MVSEEVLLKIANLPTTPGVYLWHDEYKRIIYEGKAVNLRNRVKSYVRKDSNRTIKVAAMMKKAVNVEVIQTKTEMEALILEATLIKEHHPKYIMLRDDKTYPYIKVTVQEDFPRVLMVRRMERDGAKYYGPFTDVMAVHRSLKLFHRQFPLRQCRNMNVDRPCLQYHMGFCAAPCCSHIDKATYRGYIDEIIDVLEGRPAPILKQLKEDMEAASEELRFEDAARYRDQLKGLELIREKQRMVTQRGDIDVIGIASEPTRACVQLFFIRHGKLMGRENFFIKPDGDSDEVIVNEFVKQYYGGASFVPKELLLPMATEEQELFAEWFSSMKGQQVEVTVPQRGYKMDLIRMAHENAQHFLEERHRQWQYELDKSGGAVKKLAEALDLPRLPERMECFDISHIQGAETVASMVVFENGKPAKKEYRRFKLKTVQGTPDDFKSMVEVMERRYGKETDWPMPDLIVIDGGKGQLSSVLPVIRATGITDVPVISLAKREEEVFVEGKSDSILLDYHSPELQLLQQIRDEAHRFAITYHRQLRGKRNLESVLDHVEGIGPKRRKALWDEFKSLEAMKEASVEQLAAVPGMNYKAAEAVYNFFKLSKDEKRVIIEG